MRIKYVEMLAAKLNYRIPDFKQINFYPLFALSHLTD